MEILSYLLGKKASGGGGGSSKFTYEEGTYEPTKTTDAYGKVNFSKEHSKPPTFVIIYDDGEAFETTKSNVMCFYVDLMSICNNSVANITYKSLVYGLYLGNSTGATTTKTITQTHGIDEEGSSANTDYSRTYVNEGWFELYTSNTGGAYWRNGRTYKWLAIWFDE